MLFNRLFFYKQIFCCSLNMPFYAVILKASKTGSIAENWDTARDLINGTPNSYSKKFNTKIEAEKYISNFKFKIVPIIRSNNDNKGVKRKRLESLGNDQLKKHIQEIKLAFTNLQVDASVSNLSVTSKEQINDMFYSVIFKLNAILGEVDTIVADDSVDSDTKVIYEHLTYTDNKDSSSTNIDNDLVLSEIEDAKKLFLLNTKNEVIVYTDGACSNNGYNGASAGAGVWFGNNHPLNLSIKVPGIQTNNNAEIYATIKAIERVKATGLTRVSIHTDSDFVIKSVNEWMPRWKKNGWKTSTGAEVKNKDMFMILHQRIKSMNSVSWTHVPGHKGIVGNEEADKLARVGAKK